VANSTSKPDEETALLNRGDSNAIDSSLGDAIKPTGDGSGNSDGSERGIDDVVEEEAGNASEENPLFEGNAEMRKKLYLLCPAVGIGVRLLGPFVLYVPIIRHKALISIRCSSLPRIKPSL